MSAQVALDTANYGLQVRQALLDFARILSHRAHVGTYDSEVLQDEVFDVFHRFRLVLYSLHQ